MTDFTRPLTGFRFVNTLYGDTLQKVALRELGDASLWSNIAWLNDLLPPYITDDPAQVAPGVLLSGSAIRVPAAIAEVDADVSPDEVFLVDVQLTGGRLQFFDGDVASVGGRANLAQAVQNRIATNHNELLFHPTYGANLGTLVGQLSGPVRELISEQYIEEAMADENRISSVVSVTATTVGDKLSIKTELQPISGAQINLTQEV